jgi:putative transposase
MTANKTKNKPGFDPRVIDELLAGGHGSEDILGPGGLLKRLTAAIVERVLSAELTAHLGYEPGEGPSGETSNTRNGSSAKTLLTDQGTVDIRVPRDREGSFEPQLVKKHQRRLEGFDEKVLALYARGMTVRDIQSYLEELYGTEVSPDLISRVTDSVLEEVSTWQGRTLDPVWPIVYLDALFVKIRDGGPVRSKAVYIALGVNMDGTKEVLGLWTSENEGAKFWLGVLTELKNRGLSDILVACCDGLKGFPEAIEAALPRTTVQTCLVHQVRSSCRHVSFKEQRAVAKDLRAVYTAATEAEALDALAAFETTWEARYPSIARAWLENWSRLAPFFAFPLEIRRAIYTTNAIESLNRQLRKTLKTRGHFPNDQSALKVIYLALGIAAKRWTMPFKDWGRVLQQLAIFFPGRVRL